MKTSWSREIYSPLSYIVLQRLQDVFKTSWLGPIYSSWSYVFKTSSRRFQNVFKTFSKLFAKMFSWCLQDVLQKRLQDIFKTFLRRIQDVLQICLQNVFKMYHQVKLFLLTRLRDIFNMFLRYATKAVIYRKIYLGHASEKLMVSLQNLQGW